MTAREGAIDVRVDDSQYLSAMRRLKSFDPELRKELRKNINRAARGIVNAQRIAVADINSMAATDRGRKRARAAGDSSAFGGGHAARTAHSITKKGFTNSAVAQASGAMKRSMRSSGLRDTVARSLRVVQRDQQRDPGIRVESEGGRMPGSQRGLPWAMDRGRWTHPVYGHRGRIVAQSATPSGWFSKSGREQAPKVRAEIEAAIKTATHRIESGPQ